ncbi:Fic family protein [Hydrogenophaga sp.]|uniref:Fic family protein n=1 Tax=Hydrogenophaga sp. TaxID=1904254 RepID=UPI003F71BB0A
MKSGEYRPDARYIWQSHHWPALHYDLPALSESLSQVIRAQGLLLGRMADAGLASRDRAALSALTEDVLKTSAIEGEQLNEDSVRSSVARRLGVDIGALAPTDRHVDGVVDMVLDATGNCQMPLSADRLYGWHAALFPTGFGSLTRIRVGAWRNDASGAMQVVSGPVQRQRVHFEAPPAQQLDLEMARFLDWANAPTGEAAVIKAGLAHLWFVTLHPFDDGNGRIARAVGDLFLARGDGSPQRFYSLSSQIQRERKGYYEILERTQRGNLDVTAWLAWFITALQRAVDSAHHTLDSVLLKSTFWQRWAQTPLNDRQVSMLNRVLDGFEGRLTSGQWAKLTKCSSDTALRDIQHLVSLGALRKTEDGGRSTAYELVSSRSA